jgi:hypothetical protein
MVTDYEKAARLYCEEMGLDPDAPDYVHKSYFKHPNWMYWVSRLREHDAMNRALKAVETNDE